MKYNLSISQSPHSKAEKQVYEDYVKEICYLLLVSSLLFATQTCLDIQFAISLITQFSSNPSVILLKKAECILHYFKRITNFQLVLNRHAKRFFDLDSWTNSNWAQDLDYNHSVSFIFDIVRGIVFWSLKKQPTVAALFVKTKYIASTKATKKVIQLQMLLLEPNFPQITVTTRVTQSW